MTKLNYKAGRDTGSLTNWLMGAANRVKPEVGMGATILMWTDRHAVTIVEVSLEGKKRPFVIIQEDKAVRTDNNQMSENQHYTYTPDLDAPKVKYTLRKDGTWVKDGEPLKGGQRIMIGERDHYHDFSF